ncbi:2OG-Fe(II) oxygenase [Pseudomonas sp. UL073]|uniref:2OG-Fe(II) oxygenase n=1 Tax=Zestomonas insulae TaxID=2809017 RepID=A0ABS2IHB3_9GAMM|nr:2OG-Fe(II) oxygenase [Pseudomonas insulae]MBM7062449.1 2OG-Fe(II) oxygenase [Pseudomonas insulae]
MSALADPTLLSRIVDDLAQQGWSRQAAFLPDDLTRQLAEECRQRAQQGALTPAAVGRGGSQQVREGVRGDRIQWLEAGQTAVCDRYLALMDGLRQALNEGLYLGLADFESHFACYPPGAFYQRHVDRFRDDDRRVVSALVYLNDEWQAGDGGALRLHLADGAAERALDIPPLGGSLVLFLSAELPHEVLPASRERLSLAGWFRRRAL